MSLTYNNLRFKAVYDYNAERSNELTFRKIDLIEEVIIKNQECRMGL